MIHEGNTEVREVQPTLALSGRQLAEKVEELWRTPRDGPDPGGDFLRSFPTKEMYWLESWLRCHMPDEADWLVALHQNIVLRASAQGPGPPLIFTANDIGFILDLKDLREGLWRITGKIECAGSGEGREKDEKEAVDLRNGSGSALKIQNRANATGQSIVQQTIINPKGNVAGINTGDMTCEDKSGADPKKKSWFKDHFVRLLWGVLGAVIAGLIVALLLWWLGIRRT